LISTPVDIPFNDLSRGWLANSKEVQEACNRVIQSGYYIHGPEHAAFEYELALFLGVESVIGVASGTDALELALKAVGCKTGSKIITAANAGGYTSVVAAGIGCEITYCDVDPEKLVISENTLSPLLSHEIVAVVVTHLYGNIAPVEQIRELCEPYGIKVIEDCAQAIGGLSGYRRVGSVGHIGAFSFFPTKNLGAAGDGGAVATSDPELATKLRKLRQYGWGQKYSIDLSGGTNSRLDEMQAAILRVGLPKVDSLNQKRRDIVGSYRKALQGTDLHFVTENSPDSTAHLAVLRLPWNIVRSDFQKVLKEKGVQTAVHFPILDCDQVGLPPQKIVPVLPESRLAKDEIVSLPCFPEMTSQEVSIVTNSVLEILG